MGDVIQTFASQAELLPHPIGKARCAKRSCRRRPAFATGRCRLAIHLLRTCLMLLIAVLAGCSPPPPAMPADLAYPVLVLFPQSGSVRHDDVADLKIMSVQRVMGANGDVYLIDSRLDIFRLDKLESEHSGLWLMAHPNGRTEVRFELQRTGTADAIRARQLIIDRDARMDSAEEATLRAAILEAESLKDMLQIIGK